MSAVTAHSVTAARLSAKTSLRNSRAQRISSAARVQRRANATRGFVVRAEDVATNGNGTSPAIARSSSAGDPAHDPSSGGVNNAG